MLSSEFICVISTISSYLGNWGKRVNFGNGVAEIQQKYEREREKVGERKFSILVITLPKFLLPKLADRVGVKCSKCPKRNQLWQCHCRNREVKKNCGNTIAENGRKKLWLPKSGEELKKKCYVYNIFITFSQQITGD